MTLPSLEIKQWLVDLHDPGPHTRQKAVKEAHLLAMGSNPLPTQVRGMLGEILYQRLQVEEEIQTHLVLADSLEPLLGNTPFRRNLWEETVGRALYQAKRLTLEQLQRALVYKHSAKKSMAFSLAALNYIDEEGLLPFLARACKEFQVIPLVNLHHLEPRTKEAIPLSHIKKHLVLPVLLDNKRLYLAMHNPYDLGLINDLQFMTNQEVVPYAAIEYYLHQAINACYQFTMRAAGDHQVDNLERLLNLHNTGNGNGHASPSQSTPATSSQLMEGSEGTDIIDPQVPVVNLSNLLLKEAIRKGASDIHIEPQDGHVRIRFRIDGFLTTVMTPPNNFRDPLISRIKILSNLDIAEKRLPQDGAFKARLGKKQIDFRVSTAASGLGEKMVIRVLDKSTLKFDLGQLGTSAHDLEMLTEAMNRSYGMILITGPTGSGKTTTLYSILQKLNTESRNIMTAEDPIEYQIDGLNQFQIHPKIGLTFARLLRSFLRQDPDVIMLGEIRDLETAEIAVRAALTGHLVLSTLHTNNAPETVTRLLDMGVEPMLLTTALNLIVAQRLIRKICPHCKEEVGLNAALLRWLEAQGKDPATIRLFKGRGCPQCHHCGYNGRAGIYEVLPMHDEIREMIVKGKASPQEVRQRALALGMTTLQDQGWKFVQEGITTFEEWLRVTW